VEALYQLEERAQNYGHHFHLLPSAYTSVFISQINTLQLRQFAVGIQNNQPVVGMGILPLKLYF
jgi:hypothetical protein